MRKSYRLLAGSVRSALAALVFLVGSAGAVPAGFNVQGRLTDSTGVNRNGTFSLKFTLFDSVTAGNNLWSKTFASVGVTNGGFQISLADPDDTGRQLASTLSAVSLFLEIQVLSGPGISAPESPLVPRQQLLSVPFSFAAGGIASSGPAVVNVGGAEQMRITSQGFVGIGTTNPTNALSVSGNANVTGNVSAGSFSGSGGGLSGVPWSGLAGFPGGCPGGQFVTSVGGSLSCASPPTSPTPTPPASGNVVVPVTFFTNTNFSVASCLASVTLTTGANRVRVDYSGTVMNSVAGPATALSVSQDGALVSPWDATHGIVSVTEPVGNFDLNGSFSVVLPSVSAGSHTWCLLGAVTSGNGGVRNTAGYWINVFAVTEVK